MQIHSLFQLFEEFVGLEGPILALEELRILADEHLGGLFVALQLPLEPGEGGNGELATVRLTISASVPNGALSAGWYPARGRPEGLL